MNRDSDALAVLSNRTSIGIPNELESQINWKYNCLRLKIPHLTKLQREFQDLISRIRHRSSLEQADVNFTDAELTQPSKRLFEHLEFLTEVYAMKSQKLRLLGQEAMWRPYMTAAKFLGFLTPSPPCPHLGLIYSTKFTQPPLLKFVSKACGKLCDSRK